MKADNTTLQCKPACDIVAEVFAQSLSLETKMHLYQDLKSQYPDEARDIMEQGSTEDALNEFAFIVAWHLQHRLLVKIGMDDDEIERRVYNNGKDTCQR